MSFKDKVILITGGNSGIGAACALHFAKEGALLALTARTAEKFEKVLEDIKESGVEEEPLVIVADVTTDSEHIISETIEKYGKLDILFNNAGFALLGTIETLSMEDYDSMMMTNVRGVLDITQKAIPHLAATKGCIINNSSVAALRTYKNFLGYCMSKAALDQFTKCVAMEVADKGIRVNSINAAFIDTDFQSKIRGIERSDDEYADVLEVAGQGYPLGRYGEVEDCVNAVAFLAKDSSSFLTGVILVVDGGVSVKGP